LMPPFAMQKYPPALVAFQLPETTSPAPLGTGLATP
jgi:hypothetical protein